MLIISPKFLGTKQNQIIHQQHIAWLLFPTNFIIMKVHWIVIFLKYLNCPIDGLICKWYASLWLYFIQRYRMISLQDVQQLFCQFQVILINMMKYNLNIIVTVNNLKEKFKEKKNVCKLTQWQWHCCSE